jgi:hypothetical protein
MQQYPRIYSVTAGGNPTNAGHVKGVLDDVFCVVLTPKKKRLHKERFCLR